jgi:hypothetical protein
LLKENKLSIEMIVTIKAAQSSQRPSKLLMIKRTNARLSVEGLSATNITDVAAPQRECGSAALPKPEKWREGGREIRE